METITITTKKTIRNCNSCPFKVLHWTTHESYNYCSKAEGHTLKVDGNSKLDTRFRNPVRIYYIDKNCPLKTR